MRSHLDGSHLEMVREEEQFSQYKGLSIDEETNTLYWTLLSISAQSFIKSLSIAEFEANRENAVRFLFVLGLGCVCFRLHVYFLCTCKGT